MAIVSDLMAFGMCPPLALRLGDTIVTGVAAAGTTQALGTLLTGSIVSVSTVTAAANAVTLPTSAQLASSGYPNSVRVTNVGAAQLQVFPPSGAAINSLATNAAFVMDIGTTLNFKQLSSTSWVTDVNVASVATALTAAGTNAATALVLTNLVSEITTVASGTGVRLPTVMGVGQSAFIANGAAANAVLIYPPTGATFYNSGASLSVAAGLSAIIVRTSATQVYSNLSA